MVRRRTRFAADLRLQRGGAGDGVWFVDSRRVGSNWAAEGSSRGGGRVAVARDRSRVRAADGAHDKCVSFGAALCGPARVRRGRTRDALLLGSARVGWLSYGCV